MNMLLRMLVICVLFNSYAHGMNQPSNGMSQASKRNMQRRNQHMRVAPNPALYEEEFPPLTHNADVTHPKIADPAPVPVEKFSPQPMMRNTPSAESLETLASVIAALPPADQRPVQASQPSSEVSLSATAIVRDVVKVANETAAPEKPTLQPSDEAKKSAPIGAFTKMIYMGSDHMTFALALLKNKTGTAEEVGHQVDRAIRYVNQLLESIANSASPDSIESLELIIEKQKPHIENLRTLIDLVQENNVQAQEPCLNTAWRAIQAHNALRKKRSWFVAKDDSASLQKNKRSGKKILALKLKKEELSGEVSDQEYNDFTGLFVRVLRLEKAHQELLTEERARLTAEQAKKIAETAK